MAKWLYVAAAAAAALAWRVGSTSSKPAPSPSTPSSSAERRAKLRPYLDRLEQAWPWPGLADYMEVVSHQESRGRLDTIGDGGLALGPYGVHTTAGAHAELRSLGYLDEAVLTDPAVAVAVAVAHAANLLRKASYDYPMEDARWADLRAGWAIPRWLGRRDAPPQLGKVRAGVVGRYQRAAELLDLGQTPDALARPAHFRTLGQVLDLLSG